MQRQWPMFPDASWWSHSQKLMATKLSKHRTNKEKISSHPVEKFGISTALFFTVISHACKRQLQSKNCLPTYQYHRADLQNDTILLRAYPPHPSFEHKAQHYIWWNKPLIRTNKFFFVTPCKYLLTVQNKEKLPVDTPFFQVLP